MKKIIKIYQRLSSCQIPNTYSKTHSVYCTVHEESSNIALTVKKIIERLICVCYFSNNTRVSYAHFIYEYGKCKKSATLSHLVYHLEERHRLAYYQNIISHRI